MRLAALLQVIYFSRVMFVFHVTSQTQCTTGWFGLNCKYRCHCDKNSCGTDGLCTKHNLCQTGWFGPRCQFVDIAYLAGDRAEITDENDSTCITAASKGTVSVKLNTAYHLTWLRVRLSSPGFLDALEITYKNNSHITPPTQYTNVTIDDITVDIDNTFSEPVDEVSLSGAGASRLCSLYVSGGRNVALKETAIQSSTYVEQSIRTGMLNVSFSADKAVDGNTNQHFYKGRSCSHTGPKVTSTVSWNISFSQPRLITRYFVYNRVDDKVDQLHRFLAESTDNDSAILFTFRDSAPQQQAVYTWTHHPLSVSRVFISRYQSQDSLALCEVEVYGDSDCLDGSYGLDCEHTCHCPENVSCYYSTGGCPFGCPDGFNGEDCKTPCAPDKYGPGCVYTCSEFCVSNRTMSKVCHETYGTCLHGCVAGYRGLTCNATCTSDKYGLGCVYTCSEFCVSNTAMSRSCNHKDGTCLHGCVAGYRGLTCNATCLPHHYGIKCANNCSDFCLKNNSKPLWCQHTDGRCLFGCVDGYMGATCRATCLRNTYGSGCASNCSQLCARDAYTDTPCDHTNGSCLRGCVYGYTGSFCTTKCAIDRFGPECMSPCSKHCAPTNNATTLCDHINGTCLRGCRTGYIGAMCLEGLQFASTDVYIGLSSGLIFLVVAIVCLHFCIWRNRKLLLSSEEGHWKYRFSIQDGDLTRTSGPEIKRSRIQMSASEEEQEEEEEGAEDDEEDVEEDAGVEEDEEEIEDVARGLNSSVIF